MVSQPGAQFNKSDASADSATPASIVKLYVLMPIIKRVDQQGNITNEKWFVISGEDLAKPVLFSIPVFSVCVGLFLP